MIRFHLVSLPHTNTTEAFSSCAFTEKVRKFAAMMKGLGHEVILYAGEFNEAPCDEHVVCISEAERRQAMGTKHYCEASWDPSLPHWVTFNTNTIAGIKARARPRDFICLIGGTSQKCIADAFPGMITVEFGVGHGGSFSQFRVFESYAWMHTVYGAEGRNPSATDGRWFDAVIPGYFEPEKFPFSAEKSDYYCFVGRLIERKGYQIAVDACRAKGAKLLIAGQGTPPDYGEYLGVIGPEERGKLMANAIASFAPTVYIEPFGNVVPEAMSCGTPVITTDWGAFTETNIHGETGFRCRSLNEFIEAMDACKTLDPYKIRDHALSHYSVDVIAHKYDAYFKRLSTLWGDGWYQTFR